MSYLFLFTISPVQSFIVQARKTQDLYAGSQLLSDLCKVGVETVKKQYQGNIIFPNEDNKFFPNRFLAEVPEQSTHFEEIGKAIELEVREYFEKRSENILRQQKFPEDFDRPKFEKQFKKQISNHLDIHWVFYPIKNDNDYACAYREIEKLLGAIKNVRTFDQLRTFDQFGEMGRKCSLDGERNALFYRCKNDGKAPAHIEHNGAVAVDIEECGKEYGKKRNYAKKYKLTPGEGLSAVSLVKRYYKSSNQKIDPVSTADVALMKYLKEIEASKEGVDLINFLRNNFDKESDYNQLYYEENLTEKYFDKNGLSDKKALIPNIKEKLEKLNNFKKTRYYALIAFDGDNMGKWLSGKNLTDKTQVQLKEFHLALSKKLGEFAKLARDCLRPYGQAIYAGGDDFLGFVNLNHLFEVMKHLRESFDCKVNKQLRERFECTEDLTFSAGIVIAHYKMPLHIVLLKARALEKVAKDKDGGRRNAFAIGAMKHSGESLQVCYKWQENEEENGEWNTDRIYRVVEQLQENFSDTFIRNLDSELRLLVDEKGRIEKKRQGKIVEVEMKRLIKRSCQSEQSEYLQEQLYNQLYALLDDKRYRNFLKIRNFLETLNIASFLSKEIGIRGEHE